MPATRSIPLVVVVERRRHRRATWLVVVSPCTGIVPNANAYHPQAPPTLATGPPVTHDDPFTTHG